MLTRYRQRLKSAAMLHPKSRFVVVILILFTAFAVTFWLLQLRINVTDSMPHGIYRVVAKPAVVGSFVEVCLPVPIAKLGRDRGYIGVGTCANQTEAVLKQVVGVGGDTIFVTAKGVLINGKLLPHSGVLSVDEQHRPLLSQVSTSRRVLTADEVWLYGTQNQKSWDSRYYGAVKRNTIQHVLTPVWIWRSK